MRIGDIVKVKFSRFKREYEVNFGSYGFVLERLGGGVCLYVTGLLRDDIYCVAPLGMDKDFKDTNYYIYSVDENVAFFRAKKAVLMFDFEKKICSTNVENFKVIGSKEWGVNCLVPWKDAYTKRFAAAEKRRTSQENQGGEATGVRL